MTAGEFGATIYRRAERKGPGEFSIDSRMLSVLMEIDGKRSAAQIARQKGISLQALKQVIARLLEQKLIEPVQVHATFVDRDFLFFLRRQLSQAVGPIAEILIEDAVADLGHRPNRFPAHLAAELVDLLARDIRRQDKAIVFKRNIMQKIRDKGY